MPSTFDYNKAKVDGRPEVFYGKIVMKKFPKHTENTCDGVFFWFVSRPDRNKVRNTHEQLC